MTEAPAAPAPPAKPARHDLQWLRLVLLLCVFGLYLGNALCTNVEFTAGHTINSALALPGAGLLLLIYGHYARGLRRGQLLAWLLAPVLVLACVAALAHGNHNFGWTAHPLAGRWIILGALAAGTAGALVYLIDAAVRRVRLPLGAWLILLCAHAAGMVLVSRYFAWRAGVEGAGAAVWSVDLALLALALAVLLLRAGVVAARSAEWWPAWLVHASGPEANVARGTPLRFPRLPVVLLYACSPLLWWLAGLQLLEFSMRGAPSDGGGALFALIWGGLCLRAACAGGALYGAEYALRKARREGDSERKAVAEGFLFRNGYAWAGLLAIYAFVFAAQRVQENELARVLQATEAPLVAEMRATQPPAVTPRANAANWYRQAAVALPAVSDYGIFYNAWLSPDALQWSRSAKPAQSLTEAGAILQRCQWTDDWGAPVQVLMASTIDYSAQRSLASMLMLDARYAAMDRDWLTVLGNLRRTLALARHLASDPFYLSCALSSAQEDIAVTAVLPALLWHPDGPAEEDVLAKAQEILREHEELRGNPSLISLRFETMIDLRRMNQEYASRVSQWPGESDVHGLMIRQPLNEWTGRQRFIEWHDRVGSSALVEGTLANLDKLMNERGRPFTATLHAYGPQNFLWDWDTVAEIRLARAALAATRFKLRQGYWPADLTDCVPEFLESIPIDPYCASGKIRIAHSAPRIWYAAGSGDPRTHSPRIQEGDEFQVYLGASPGTSDGVFYLEPPPPEFGAVESWRLYDQVAQGREREALKDSTAAVWKEAARHLATMETEAWSAREDVFAMAGEPDPERRMWAAFLLGTMSHAEDPVGAHLERLGKDTDPDVARVARWSQLWLRTLARREAESKKNAAPKDATAEPLKE